MNWRHWTLLGALLLALVVVGLLPPIPQSETYHDFADARAFLGIPNCLNVLSNAAFLLVAIPGIVSTVPRAKPSRRLFLESGECWPWLGFFLGVALTAFGSAYYHLRPNNGTLVWGRIPMTISFLSLVAAMLSERISIKLGLRLLLPLVVFGIGSVLYWHVTQLRGDGDLRSYVLAQFGAIFVLLPLIALFPPRYTRTWDLALALALYALAKLFEVADRSIFSLGGIVSGHTLKHLAAAASAYWILRMLKVRAPVSADLPGLATRPD